MDDHLLACQQFLTESHIFTRIANERASLFNMNDINYISILERLTVVSVNVNGNSMEETISCNSIFLLF
jgi:hypothetical protein